MIIDKELIVEAKEKLGVRNADIIAETLEIENYNPTRKVGCCPNPNHEDDTPSCSYNPKTFSFHCFGCGYNVDVLEAYMLKHHESFSEACERLFNEAGVTFDFGERGVTQGKRYYYPKPKYADTKDKVYSYWQARGISPKTIDYLGVEQDLNGNTLFQYWDLNDVLVTVKVRKSGKVEHGKTKIWFLKDDKGQPYDSTNILYNINKINTSQPLIITSGEGDCMAAVECGFPNTVSINGGDGNTQWIGECWDFLQQFDDIVIIHDNDESGKKFAKEVTTRLGEYRVKVVDIPTYIENEDGTKIAIKDLNEFLFRCGKEAVRDAINNARESEIPSIVDYTDVKRFDMSDVDGFETGFKELDNAIDKFYMGTTTVLTGITGSGKSSLISTLVAKSIEQGFPALVYSGELDNASLKNWIDFVHAGQRGLNEYHSGDRPYYKIKSDVYDKINEHYKGKLYFYKDGFEHKISRLLATMEAAVRQKSVKTIVIDNMTSVDLENNDTNKYIKQDEFIREVIDFSKRWQVCCILVLHPKKLDEVKRLSIFDLQGCVSAVNLAHRVITLYRVSPKEKEPQPDRFGKTKEPIKYDVILDVLKDRFGSAMNKSVGLYYDIPSRRFYDSAENLDYQYEWDRDTKYTTPLPFGAQSIEEEFEIFGEA